MSNIKDLISTNNLSEILKIKSEIDELLKYIPVELLSYEKREMKEEIDNYLKIKNNATSDKNLDSK